MSIGADVLDAIERADSDLRKAIGELSAYDARRVAEVIGEVVDPVIAAARVSAEKELANEIDDRRDAEAERNNMEDALDRERKKHTALIHAVNAYLRARAALDGDTLPDSTGIVREGLEAAEREALAGMTTATKGTP